MKSIISLFGLTLFLSNSYSQFTDVGRNLFRQSAMRRNEFRPTTGWLLEFTGGPSLSFYEQRLNRRSVVSACSTYGINRNQKGIVVRNRVLEQVYYTKLNQRQTGMSVLLK